MNRNVKAALLILKLRTDLFSFSRLSSECLNIEVSQALSYGGVVSCVW